VDQDGLKIEELSHGRKLTPSGDLFRLNQQKISEMSLPELSAHIELFRSEVRKAQASLDRNRTQLAVAENVYETKVLADARRKRSTSRVFAAGEQLKFQLADKPSPAERLLHSKIDAWKADGFTEEEIVTEILALRNNK
jgi:hypothetical protein